jgi:hypothetical protein
MTITKANEVHFKFRAECQGDAFRFVAGVLEKDKRARAFNLVPVIGGTFITVEERFSDAACELITTLTLDSLKDLTKVGSDLHVIAETIKPVEEYTGVRERATGNRPPAVVR